MLPEIAAEALHFLTRRDLDNACAVSKWLDEIIAQCCEVYPLRPLRAVRLWPIDSMFNVHVVDGGGSSTDRLFSSLNKAVHFAGAILRFSYTGSLQLGLGNSRETMTLSPNHWATIVEALRSGAVRRFYFRGVDLSTLDDSTFLVALDSRGLHSFSVEHSVVPRGFYTDNLIRASAAKGVLELEFSHNKNDAPLRFSEEALLDFFFRVDAAPQSIRLMLDGTGITDMFLKKRLESSPDRPSGVLTFCGSVATQRDLSAYDRYLAPDGTHNANTAYRFPSMDKDNMFYKVELSEASNNLCTYFWIHFGHATQ